MIQNHYPHYARRQLTGVTRLSQSIDHSSHSTCNPTVAIVNRPTHFMLATAPRDIPVPICHIHHHKLNGILQIDIVSILLHTVAGPFSWYSTFDFDSEN
jgi:hypothetical protein